MEQDESGFSFSAARYWIRDENHFPGPERGGRGGCTASEISKAVTTFFVVYFAAIAAASVGILIGKFVNPPGGWYKKLIQVYMYTYVFIYIHIFTLYVSIHTFVNTWKICESARQM